MWNFLPDLGYLQNDYRDFNSSRTNFIAAAMFPATRRFATNWLHAVLTPNVIVLLMIVTCDLVLSGITTAYTSVVGKDSGSSFVIAFILQIALVIVVGLFLAIPRIAISLVGSGFEASSSGMQGIMNKGSSGLKSGLKRFFLNNNLKQIELSVNEAN